MNKKVKNVANLTNEELLFVLHVSSAWADIEEAIYEHEFEDEDNGADIYIEPKDDGLLFLLDIKHFWASQLFVSNRAANSIAKKLDKNRVYDYNDFLDEAAKRLNIDPINMRHDDLFALVEK